jgi:hypothetical protein
MALSSNSHSLSDNDSSSRGRKQGSQTRNQLDPALPSYMPPPRKTRSKRTPALLAVLAAACVAVPGVAWFRWSNAPAAAEAAPPAAVPAPAVAAVMPDAETTGKASINSSPAGATVVIDGQERGITPALLALPPGEYTVELRRGNISRALPVIVEADATVEASADLTPSLSSSGRLVVTSDPPGADVTVNGTPRGKTPLVLAAVPAGRHRVTVSDGAMTVNRNVDVVAGANATVTTTMSRAASANGWISVSAPIDLQVYSGGRLLGAANERIPMPVGTYELEIVSPAFQFKTTATARVNGQQVADVAVQLPTGRVSMNAVPWADVWLDGRSLGQTPLGQVALPIGEHELVFRHPQLGERKQIVRVTPGANARVGVDFSR